MKILFISYLNNDISQGPTWSVPASVNAQSTIDDVLWIDLGDAQLEHWKAVNAYHNISEFGKLSLDYLPDNFKTPDLVVFEGFYKIAFVTFSKELLREGIPYVIVPRCSLTEIAHNTKRYKKWVADFFFFRPFTQKALCIQYLSEDERGNSSFKWNKTSIVVPNGVDLPIKYKENYLSEGIKAIFVGRLNSFHKGLDILLEACSKVKPELETANFHLTLYGEKRRDYEILNKYVQENKLEDVVSFGGLISGEKKIKCILSADLHIMTSRFEGMPMAMIETLAYGVPALVTPGTNIKEEIVGNNAGWGCDCDVDSVSDALLTIIQEKNSLEQKGRNARILAKKYSWTDIAEDFHRSIIELLKK